MQCLDRTFRQKRVEQRLDYFFGKKLKCKKRQKYCKRQNMQKAKILRNITNVNELQKLTFRERKTSFNRIFLQVKIVPHSDFTAVCAVSAKREQYVNN